MIDNFMDFFIFAKISRSEKRCADYGIYVLFTDI